MKYYGIERNNHIETLKRAALNLYTSVHPYWVIDGKKREFLKETHRHLFNDHSSFHRDNSIPNGKYCIPFAFVASDLVLKEDIDDLQAGLIKLLKKQAAKDIGIFQSADRIRKTIEKMDDAYSRWYSDMNIGFFDYPNKDPLSRKISYFTLYIREVNASYLSVEITIFLTQEYIKELTNIVNSDYIDRKGHVCQTLHNHRNKSGGRIAYSISWPNESTVKSTIIYNKILKLKWELFDSLSKILPLFLQSNGSIPPSVLLYKTNISACDAEMDEFLDSVGVSSYRGLFITPNDKLFFETSLTERHYSHAFPTTDKIYLVNNQTMPRESMYYHEDFQYVDRFVEGIYAYIFPYLLAERLNALYSEKCIAFRNDVNRIKLKRRKYSKILKVRYKYVSLFDCFKRFYADTNWDMRENKLAALFNIGCTTKHTAVSPESLSSSIRMGKRICDRYDSTLDDVAQKIEVIRYLKEYKSSKSNWKLNVLMLVLTAITLMFIVFPDWATATKTWLIETAWPWIYYWLK